MHDTDEHTLTHRERLLLGWHLVEMDQMLRQAHYLGGEGLPVDGLLDTLQAEHERTLREWAGIDYDEQLIPNFLQEAREYVAEHITELDRIRAEHRERRHR